MKKQETVHKSLKPVLESDVRKELAEIKVVIEILKKQVGTLANVLGIGQPMYTEEEYKEIAEYRKRKGQ